MRYRDTNAAIPPRWRAPPCPFFPCLFGKGQGKPQKKSKDFFNPYQTPRMPGKERKTLKKNKEFLAGEKNKEFKKKARKGRTGRIHDFCEVRRLRAFQGCRFGKQKVRMFKSCESTPVFLSLQPQNPLKKPHLSAGKRSFPKESAFFH